VEPGHRDGGGGVSLVLQHPAHVGGAETLFEVSVEAFELLAVAPSQLGDLQLEVERLEQRTARRPVPAEGIRLRARRRAQDDLRRLRRDGPSSPRFSMVSTCASRGVGHRVGLAVAVVLVLGPRRRAARGSSSAGARCALSFRARRRTSAFGAFRRPRSAVRHALLARRARSCSLVRPSCDVDRGVGPDICHLKQREARAWLRQPEPRQEELAVPPTRRARGARAACGSIRSPTQVGAGGVSTAACAAGASRDLDATGSKRSWDDASPPLPARPLAA
jgi:hypothetical protein